MVDPKDRSTVDLGRLLSAAADAQPMYVSINLLRAAAARLKWLTETERPNLGLATTQQLLDELTARIDVDFKTGLPGGLGYSTVGGVPEPKPGEVRARVTPPFVVEVHVK